MPITQKIFAILTSIIIFSIIIYLIKKGKLKEEYSWLWFLTGLVLVVLVLWYDLLLLLTFLIESRTIPCPVRMILLAFSFRMKS